MIYPPKTNFLQYMKNDTLYKCSFYLKMYLIFCLCPWILQIKRSIIFRIYYENSIAQYTTFAKRFLTRKRVYFEYIIPMWVRNTQKTIYIFPIIFSAYHSTINLFWYDPIRLILGRWSCNKWIMINKNVQVIVVAWERNTTVLVDDIFY